MYVFVQVISCILTLHTYVIFCNDDKYKLDGYYKTHLHKNILYWLKMSCTLDSKLLWYIYDLLY